ncbi:MAG: lipopolysaccharide assembly protein LapA domain-containing protein [Alphaproteobacteria bacterium]|nr:lipopolysaccharide assembly protein LapA domain-containing protein [Alphaproteobacteria bacterium]
MRILFWIITVPLLLLAGAFAAANLEPVTLNLWPLPLEAEMPLFAAVLGAFFLGLLLAALWFSAARIGDRLRARRLARHERALEEETGRLKRSLAEKERVSAPRIGDDGEGERARRLIVAGDG